LRPNNQSPVPDNEWSSRAEEHWVYKILWLSGLKHSTILKNYSVKQQSS